MLLQIKIPCFEITCLGNIIFESIYVSHINLEFFNLLNGIKKGK